MQVAKALLAVFAFVVISGFALLGLAQYRLANARFTETVIVTATAPGFSPADVENALTDRIEEALSQVNGLESLRSTSSSGLAVVTAQLTAIGVDAPPPVMLAREALERIRTELPDDVPPPTLQRFELEPVTRHFVAHSDTMSRLELSRWLDEVFRRKVEVQPGVRELQLCGAVEPELKIRLDAQRMRALGVPPEDVVTALQRTSFSLPAGRVSDGKFTLRVEGGTSLEALQNLELRPQVRLSDVATLEQTGVPGDCTTAADVLVTVRVFPDTELQLPEHPAGLELKPFTPVRTAVYLSAPGSSVTAALLALAKAHPGAMSSANGETLTVFFTGEERLVDVPGLSLRSLDDGHALVQVSGPDFEQLTTLAEGLRAKLAQEQTRWLGATWPGMRPEQVIKARPGVRGLAQALRLAIGGVATGSLEDGTRVRVYAGSSLDDAMLPDGRPVSSEVEVTATLAPSAILRVNRERVVELEVGVEVEVVKRVAQGFELPPGYRVTVTERK